MKFGLDCAKCREYINAWKRLGKVAVPMQGNENEYAIKDHETKGEMEQPFSWFVKSHHTDSLFLENSLPYFQPPLRKPGEPQDGNHLEAKIGFDK